MSCNVACETLVKSYSFKVGICFAKIRLEDEQEYRGSVRNKRRREGEIVREWWTSEEKFGAVDCIA